MEIYKYIMQEKLHGKVQLVMDCLGGAERRL